DTADDLAKVSIVGTGMQSAPGYAARMVGALARAGININIISTSDIRITCVVPRARAEDAVRILHQAFELDREDSALLRSPRRIGGGPRWREVYHRGTMDGRDPSDARDRRRGLRPSER